MTLGVQLGSLPTTLGMALVARRGKLLPPPLRQLALVAAIGLLDVAADGFLTYATALGELGVVSVLSSLDPVVSVLLAQVISREHLAC